MTLEENLKKVIEMNPYEINIRFVKKNLDIFDHPNYKLQNDDLHKVEDINSSNPGFEYHLLIRTESGTYRIGSNVSFPPIKEWYK